MADRQIGFSMYFCRSYSPMDDVAGAIELSRSYAKLHCTILSAQVRDSDKNDPIAARTVCKTR